MKKNERPVILVISSYPPRVCGIATYAQDLVKTLNKKHGLSFLSELCALEAENEQNSYPEEVRHVLHTSDPASYTNLSDAINSDSRYSLVLIQHEFGLFQSQSENFLDLIKRIKVPVIVTFHTVLPDPGAELKGYVQRIADTCDGIIVMTQNASWILQKMYDLPSFKIKVIQHGTHLVEYKDKEVLKQRYDLTGKQVLSTFGLISSGKNIETTLRALPAIVEQNPDTLFLVIGRTHPNVTRHEGESYRKMLEELVTGLKMEDHVRFINDYLSLPHLLDYLQLTDIYLFTSKDPAQAVSGTFAYAMSCGCPIVSTPIPHAKELLGDDAGILIDFENPQQLSDAVNRLFKDPDLREKMRVNGLNKTASTSWENIAIAHTDLFVKHTPELITREFAPPEINLHHFKNLTSGFGMIQFSRINEPDLASGYTLDDNARALVAACMYYSESHDPGILPYMSIYLAFAEHCIQPAGDFLNYVDNNKGFTDQNKENLDDANGRAIWALGYVVYHHTILPPEFVTRAEVLMRAALKHIVSIHSTRALGFAIKGLYYYNSLHFDANNIVLVNELAARMERMYEHETSAEWQWFESYLTYGNSILPESMLCAYLMTNNEVYKEVALRSFNFLLANTFSEDQIKPISNKSWLHKGKEAALFGEQPIDVSYTILALDRFFTVFGDEAYLKKIHIAFSWFCGNNHLKQIIYNPSTGGCYDGLEENCVNLNQGAESTVSYLMARFIIEKYNTGHLTGQEKPHQATVPV